MLLSFNSKYLNIIVIICIIYSVYTNFKMPKHQELQIHNQLSETEMKIQKIKKEMQTSQFQDNSKNSSFVQKTELKNMFEEILNDLFGEHLKILMQIKSN